MGNIYTIEGQLSPIETAFSGTFYAEKNVSGAVLNTLDVLTGYIYPGNTISGSMNTNLIRGFSAYEEAVFRGFEGTLDEWLESLKINAGGSSCDCSRIPNDDIDEVFDLWFYNAD